MAVTRKPSPLPVRWQGMNRVAPYDFCNPLGLLAFGVVAAVLLTPTSDAAAASLSDDGAVLVTANKREQELADVPAAVSVVTGEAIRRARITDLRELAGVVTSLRVNQLQSLANTNFNIRGFGNGANNAGIEPSVALFVDGVYRSRSAAMIADLPDVERVEVLRGPQSTLFGKVASAGLIALVTARPREEFGGEVEASYGNFDAWRLRGMVTGPLAPGLAASLSGSYSRRDGYLRDLASGTRSGGRDRWQARGQVLLMPGSGTSLRLIGDYGEIDEICCAAVNLRASAATAALVAVGGAVNPADEPFGDRVYNNLPSTNAIRLRGLSAQLDQALGPITLTAITAHRRTDAVTDQDSDFSSAQLLAHNFQDLLIRTWTQELRLATDRSERVSAVAGFFYLHEDIAQANRLRLGSQFRPYADRLIGAQSGGSQSLAALEELFGSLRGNPSLYAGRFFAAGQGMTEAYSLHDESWSAFAQVDLKLTPRLTLTAGLSYTHDAKRFASDVASDEVFASISLADMVRAATNAGVAQQIGGLLRVPGGLASPAQVAAFAAAQPAAYQQVTAAVSARTQPLLALRTLQFLPPFLNVPNAVESGRVADGGVSYTASLAYDFGQGLRAYLRYATGFKAASINLSRDSRPSAADLSAIGAAGLGLVNLASGSRFAGPERARLYEAGLKAEWDDASANLAVFKQAIRGFQSNVFTGNGFFLANAGRQSTFGIEFEGVARPAPGLSVRLAVTYLDPRYDDFRQSAFGDLTGTVPGGASPLTTSLSARYETDLRRGKRLILGFDYHREAKFKLVDGLPGLVVRHPLTGQLLDAAPALAAARAFRQGIDDVNLFATLALPNQVEIGIWARNLLDDRMITQVFDSPLQPGSLSGYANAPRTFGVVASYSW